MPCFETGNASLVEFVTEPGRFAQKMVYFPWGNEAEAPDYWRLSNISMDECNACGLVRIWPPSAVVSLTPILLLPISDVPSVIERSSRISQLPSSITFDIDFA